MAATEMKRKSYKTLILMPYLPIEGYIKFNNLILWSFQKNKDRLIKDRALKSHLEGLVSCYQLHGGSIIKNPAVISINKVSFSNPTSKSIAKIEALKNILLFTCVLENNSWSFVTSDNFEVFYQRFNVGDENIATQAGAIHRITTGGYKLSEVDFFKPEYVHIPLRLTIISSVIKALEDCLIHSATQPPKSQIIQSLSPFFGAYRNSNEHSLASRILLLIMAFELLFGETERQNFRKNVQKYSVDDIRINPPTHSYPIVVRGRTLRNENLTLNQIWAEEFYKLRNRIIHGDTVYSDDFIFKESLGIVKSRNPHFFIAVNFFVVCLLNKLKEIGFSNVPHFVINPDAKGTLFIKNISGIENELFKIQDIGIYDLLKTS